jgi:hypothetical protein
MRGRGRVEAMSGEEEGIQCAVCGRKGPITASMVDAFQANVAAGAPVRVLCDEHLPDDFGRVTGDPNADVKTQTFDGFGMVIDE